MAPRGTNPPYTATSDVDEFFERIRGINEPTKPVDTAWVASYKFESSQPQAIPTLLKWLRIIDDKGMSTGVWNKLRVASTKEEALSGLVREAYAPVFESIDVTVASKEDVEGAFLQSYSIGTPGRMLACFYALCRHAGIEVAAAAPSRAPAEKKIRTSKPAAPKPRAERNELPKRERRERDETPRRERQAASATATVSVNVELPADWDDEKVEARLALVAKALREHGLA